MIPYSNITGQSNITGYEIGKEFIAVQFKNGETYKYSYDSAGQETVEEMKELARGGSGLAGFIQTNAKYDYE